MPAKNGFVTRTIAAGSQGLIHLTDSFLDSAVCKVLADAFIDFLVIARCCELLHKGLPSSIQRCAWSICEIGVS